MRQRDAGGSNGSSCCRRPCQQEPGAQDASRPGGASNSSALQAGQNSKALDENAANNPLAASGEDMAGMMAMMAATVMLMAATVMQMVATMFSNGSNNPSAGSETGPPGGPQFVSGQPGTGNAPGADPPSGSGVPVSGGSNVSLPASSLAERFSADRVARLYDPSARQNVEQYLPHILGALKEQGIDDPQMALYALATIKVETGSFRPLNEYSGGYAYEGRADLGNTQPGDGHRFMGRGFIQLTGRSNYQSYGNALGLDLTGNPELANDPQHAARILALYLKRNEGRIRTALNNGDFAAARRVVNGGTNGLSGFQAAYQQGLQLGLA